MNRFRPAVFIWCLFGIVAVEIVFTYWRIPPHELYEFHDTGAAGGFGRALTYLNYPVPLVAIPFALLSADRLRFRPVALTAALVSIGLCAVLFSPTVINQLTSDLDPLWINALPAAGVALALVLTAASGLFGVRTRLAPATLVFAAFLLVLAIPWISADLGFFLNGVPGLGWLFRTGELYHGLPSVHHGHHHGMDGVMLALSAVTMVPLARRAHFRAVRIAVGVFAGMLLFYGLGNVTNDAWIEQVVKRGWVHTQVPSVFYPTLSYPWLGILLAGAVAAFVILRPANSSDAARAPGTSAKALS